MHGMVFTIHGMSVAERRAAGERLVQALDCPTLTVDATTSCDDAKLRRHLAEGGAVVCLDQESHQRVAGLAAASGPDRALSLDVYHETSGRVGLDDLEVITEVVSECDRGFRFCYARRLPECLRDWAKSHPRRCDRARNLANTIDALDGPGRLSVVATADLWRREKHRF